MTKKPLIDSSTLEEMAYDFHYHGDEKITFADLQMKGWATMGHLGEILDQISAYIDMWNDTKHDIHDAINILRYQQWAAEREAREAEE